ncbi:penicillin-binding protein 1C [Magnetococcus sp. PR-3]|uniref:penicillin-binding protein 1C n=1 Tax=Magnetococcus sp. PR-3 TaxID=3120355 RepID=UPI002FCE1B7C
MLWGLDHYYPAPIPTHHGGSLLITDREGEPLRAFADKQGVWRHPLTPKQVDDRYLQALLHYEDRWFYHHPGVNPLALLRAIGQWVRHGRPISGGSTLTMQVARILEPHPRTIGGKIRQMLRAFQLEWHLTKEQILTLYLNHTPMGGPLAGVGMASRTYLGKPPIDLSHAEAALLAILPQAPSYLRPDRHPKRAIKARNKLIQRMKGVWADHILAEARSEPLFPYYAQQRQSAPLLARRLKPQANATKPLVTTIDGTLQARVEARLIQKKAHLPSRVSAAVLVVENASLEVLAYAGSLDFHDADRFGHVDMVQGWRSPGSTLKPFLYAQALEQGLIHSQSLLSDVPMGFDGYRPANFDNRFNGPVSATAALRRSLNLPAVDLLHRITPTTFVTTLRQGGLTLRLPPNSRPNLSIILGGTATTLEGLTTHYALLGREGRVGPLRFLPTTQLKDYPQLNSRTAWITHRMLKRPPTQATGRSHQPGQPLIAWKTGTSYGYRDAWALGVGSYHTVGVWLGRPDGVPVPGQYGAISAAPLLFELFDLLPDLSHKPTPLTETPPKGVAQTTICWPLGLEPLNSSDPLCHQPRQAWVLSGTIPPTFGDDGAGRIYYWQREGAAHAEGWLNMACHAEKRVKRQKAQWPMRLTPWLSPKLIQRSALPKADTSCPQGVTPPSDILHFQGLEEGVILMPAGEEDKAPLISLSLLGANTPVAWLINGYLKQQSSPEIPFSYRFTKPGEYRITALTEGGETLSRNLTVRTHKHE